VTETRKPTAHYPRIVEAPDTCLPDIGWMRGVAEAAATRKAA
jgi:hypothetical protein